MTQYIEPGTYITELFKPQAVIPPGLGLNLVIVGVGSKQKSIVNEEVLRGGIYNELLTVSGTSPHSATLVNTSDQKKENTTIYADGIALTLDQWQFNSATEVQILDAYFNSGATYTIDYVAIDSYIDDLDNEIQSVDKVGLFSGSSNYKENEDFQITGGDIDWTILTDAEFTGLNTETFDVSTNKNLKLSLDGKPSITIDVSATASDPANATATEIVTDINAALVASGDYGADYGSVASDVGGKVKLTAPGLDPYVGINSIITLFTTTDSALDTIFGLSEDDAPYEYRGTGKRPLAGQTYFVDYKITRPSSDYNKVRQFNNDIDFYNDIGYPAEGNTLANAGELAWSRGVLTLFVVQVEDADDDGVYTNSDFITAIDALVDEREATDIVVLRSNATIRAKVRDVLTNESAQLKSNYKRYWCGMPRGSSLGDVDTPDTAIWVAQREFSVTPDSVARGRFIVIFPSDLQQTIVENTTEKILDVDSNYMATILAAETVSFENASNSLFGKTFSGLTVENNLSKADMRFAAANGITCVFQEGGVLKLFDVLTTDASGDARYEEPSSSTQKDNLAFKMIDAIDNNLKGIVPDNPSEFVGTIKAVAGGVILGEIESGNIGYYTDDDGNVRDIDYNVDLVAFREAGDPRNYRLRYYFNLRYVAKRFFGEFTVTI